MEEPDYKWLILATLEQLFLSLGTNRGDRSTHLRDANSRLKQVFGAPIAQSSVYETESWGYSDSPYLNQVIEFESEDEAESILMTILDIESDMGRERNADSGYEGRVIDIDILLYGSQILKLPRLRIPHPHLHERRFILTPLAEIAKTFVHPELDKELWFLLESCTDDLEVKLWKDV